MSFWTDGFEEFLAQEEADERLKTSMIVGPVDVDTRAEGEEERRDTSDDEYSSSSADDSTLLHDSESDSGTLEQAEMSDSTTGDSDVETRFSFAARNNRNRYQNLNDAITSLYSFSPPRRLSSTRQLSPQKLTPQKRSPEDRSPRQSPQKSHRSKINDILPEPPTDKTDILPEPPTDKTDILPEPPTDKNDILPEPPANKNDDTVEDDNVMEDEEPQDEEPQGEDERSQNKAEEPQDMKTEPAEEDVAMDDVENVDAESERKEVQRAAVAKRHTKQQRAVVASNRQDSGPTGSLDIERHPKSLLRLLSSIQNTSSDAVRKLNLQSRRDDTKHMAGKKHIPISWNPSGGVISLSQKNGSIKIEKIPLYSTKKTCRYPWGTVTHQIY